MSIDARAWASFSRPGRLVMKFLLGADVSFVTLSLRSGDPMLSDYLKGDSDLSCFYSRYFLRLYSTVEQNIRRIVCTYIV